MSESQHEQGEQGEPTEHHRVVVIGAGQAALSTAHFLRRDGERPGRELLVLDANPTPGGAWSHRWDALTFDDAHGIHDLPGLPLGETDPTEPAREVVKRYYGAYEEHEGLQVQRPWCVTSVRRTEDPDPARPGDRPRFLLTATQGTAALGTVTKARTRTLTASALASATGTWDRPFVPSYPGRFGGHQLTTAGFVSPDEFAGRRVLVVGGGTSAVQFLLLLREHGADTLWSTRHAPDWTEVPFDAEWGRQVEHSVAGRTRAGLPPLSVVAATGLPLIPRYVRGIEDGILISRGPIARLTEDGVDLADGSHERVDVILWATGFRAALDHLVPLHLRAAGGGVSMADDDVSVPAAPGLVLVGYGPSASTLGATRAGRRAARAVARILTPTQATEAASRAGAGRTPEPAVV